MIKQNINVHHKKFATGLFWQPVSVGNKAFNYARQLSKNTKYTLFTEYKSMVGLTNGRNGACFSMPSAAAEIVDTFSDLVSFLGVFKADNGFYLVAVRNGIIIRDILIESEKTAREIYNELSNIPDWGALFAPASWGMPRSQEKFLADIIQNNNVARLRNISIVKSLMPSIFFIAVFVLVIASVWFSPLGESIMPHKQPNIDPELEAEYKRQIELKNKELDEQFNIVKKAIEPLNRPYEHLPDVMERAKLCYKAIAFVMQPIPGWNQTYTKCDEKYVTATFKRDFGTLNDFYEVGSELFPGAVVQQLSENEMLVRVMLPELQTLSSLDERDQITAMRDITTNFQQINTGLNINGVSDTISNGEESEKINVIEVSASSKMIPSEFMNVFNGFGGVYMTSVNWSANTRTWNYEVIVYTK